MTTTVSIEDARRVLFHDPFTAEPEDSADPVQVAAPTATVDELEASQTAESKAEASAPEPRESITEVPPAYGPGDAWSPSPDGIDASNEDAADARPDTPGPSHRQPRPTQAQQRALARFTADTGGDAPIIRRMGSPDHLLEVCRVCSGPIPFPQNPCEFEGVERWTAEPLPPVYRYQHDGVPVVHVQYGPEDGRPSAVRPIVRETRPLAPRKFARKGNNGDFDCRCNGCTANLRNKGNQPEFCSSSCAAEHKRERQRMKDEAKRSEERETARLWLIEYPDASDSEVMDWSGITTRKRVAEARNLIA